jgi:Tfp pilus assembly protein PilO
MDATRLAHVNWRLRRLGRGLDWTIVVALGLAAFGIAFYFSTVAPALAHAAEQRDRFAHLRASAAQASGEATVRDPQADLAEFYASLAPPAKVPEMLRRLHRAAAGQGLAVDQADYRPQADPDGRIVRYQILMPARGSYPQVRRFLAQATRELPALAVDGVTFQRQQVGEASLEAQVKLVLFVQAGQVAEKAR